jgi:hypothetical protein
MKIKFGSWEFAMADTHTPLKPVKAVRPPSMNDNLPSSNPSRKTVLIVLGCAIVLVLVWVLFHSRFGF